MRCPVDVFVQFNLPVDIETISFSTNVGSKQSLAFSIFLYKTHDEMTRDPESGYRIALTNTNGENNIIYTNKHFKKSKMYRSLSKNKINVTQSIANHSNSNISNQSHNGTKHLNGYNSMFSDPCSSGSATTGCSTQKMSTNGLIPGSNARNGYNAMYNEPCASNLTTTAATRLVCFDYVFEYVFTMFLSMF